MSAAAWSEAMERLDGIRAGVDAMQARIEALKLENTGMRAALVDVAEWIEQTQTRDDEGAQGTLRQIRAVLAKAVGP